MKKYFFFSNLLFFFGIKYSSNKNHGSYLKYRQIVEPLLKNVDLLLFGHVHAFERTCPIYNEKCIGKYTKHYFNNPKSPIHLCIGTAGFEMNRDWEDQPNWSLFRESSHGFASITISSRNSIYVEYFQNHVSKPRDSFLIYKD